MKQKTWRERFRSRLSEWLMEEELRPMASLELFFAQEIRKAIESVKLKSLKEHHCRFNDGECDCDCFVEAIVGLESAKEKLIKELSLLE